MSTLRPSGPTTSRSGRPKQLIARLVVVSMLTMLASVTTFVPTASAAHLNSTVTLAPSGNPGGSGNALFTFYPDGTVCSAITVAGIGAVTAAHIHVGNVGVDGPVLVGLDVAAIGLSGCVSSTPEAIEAIEANPAGHYLNIHTDAYPAGAIRGQLGATADAPATTAVAVPLNATGDINGGGSASMNLDPATGRVCYELSPTNIDAPTAAHIHVGAAGMDGPVLINLDVAGNGLQGCVFVPAGDASAVVANLAGHYLNIHNASHPAGAVRAQLDKSAAITPVQSTLQLFPTGDANGSGTVMLALSTVGNVCYELAPNNIATPTAAHIHVGGPSVDGPVLINLDVAANGLSGCVSVAPADVSAVLANPGGHYVNVHNDPFPAGAVRVQVDGTPPSMPAAPPPAPPAPAPSVSVETPSTGLLLDLAPVSGLDTPNVAAPAPEKQAELAFTGPLNPLVAVVGLGLLAAGFLATAIAQLVRRRNMA